MMRKHTPGPWYTTHHFTVMGRGFRVALADEIPGQDALTRDANAALMAAAPDMLTALLNVRGIMAQLVAQSDFDSEEVEKVYMEVVASIKLALDPEEV